jgi:hypothetical protein
LEAVGVSRPTWLRKNIEAAFESFMEKKWERCPQCSSCRNRAVGVQQYRSRKMASPPGKIVAAKVDAVEAASRGGKEKRNVSFLPSPEMAGRPSA